MLIVGKAITCGDKWGIWEPSVPPSQFYCRPKTALKKNKALASEEAYNEYSVQLKPEYSVLLIVLSFLDSSMSLLKTLITELYWNFFGPQCLCLNSNALYS